MDNTTKQYIDKLGYQKWIDGIRGVAILFVILYHLNLIPGGFLGVDVFFVLSGFLITTILIEEWTLNGTINLFFFYLRRALRLTPALVVTLLMGFFYSYFFCSTEQHQNYISEMKVAACYFTNWCTIHLVLMPTLGHTWSLAVEEQFYIIWPVVLLLMLKFGFRSSQLIFVVCFGIIYSAILRLFLFRYYYDPNPDFLYLLRLYMGLDTRADALLVGCLIAFLLFYKIIPESQKTIWIVRGVSLFSICLLCYLAFNFPLTYRRYYQGFFLIVSVAVGVIIVQLKIAPLSIQTAILEFKPLVGLGKISYGLYLFHHPIMHWFGPNKMFIAILLSLMVAITSYFVVEIPFLKLKNKLRPKKQVPVQ